MAVVINEFEVVAEPAAAAPAQGKPEVEPPGPSLPALEVERIVCHAKERALRVWAH